MKICNDCKNDLKVVLWVLGIMTFSWLGIGNLPLYYECWKYAGRMHVPYEFHIDTGCYMLVGNRKLYFPTSKYIDPFRGRIDGR